MDKNLINLNYSNLFLLELHLPNLNFKWVVKLHATKTTLKTEKRYLNTLIPFLDHNYAKKMRRNHHYPPKKWKTSFLLPPRPSPHQIIRKSHDDHERNVLRKRYRI